MKKILLLFLVTTLIGVFILIQDSNKKITNEEYILDEKIYNLEYSVTYGFELNDLEEMYKGNEFIAIIYVDKVNPSTTYRDYTDEYIMPYTPGEATILKVLKGHFASEKISFSRLGGKVSYYEYEKSLYLSEREKFGSFFSEEDKNNLYINNRSQGDITIENNKMYLAYMNRNDDFHKKNEYNIEALEYGLREVKIEVSNSNLTSSNIKIKNNKTDEYENIKKAVSSKLVEKI